MGKTDVSAAAISLRQAIEMQTPKAVELWLDVAGDKADRPRSDGTVAIVLWSSILPLVLKKIRIDPAVVSAPMIATIVDGTGLMIYFVIAHATLPQLAGL